MKQIRYTIIASILLFFALQACHKVEKAGTQKPAPKIPLVNIEHAVKTKMVAYIEFTGTVQANIVSDVNSPIDGVIESLYARENKHVTKDRIVAIINPNDRQALISSNQMEILKLEQQIKNAGSDELTELENALEKANSNLEYAKKMYHTVPVVCPMNGIVTYRWLDTGNQVAAKEKIITISDMNSLVIKAEVNEKYFEEIKQGKKLPIFLSAYPNDTLQGHISLVYPQVDPVTRSVKFDIKIVNFNKTLIPGMMASIKIPVSATENAIVVSEQAILTTPDNKNFLFVVNNDSLALRRIVQIGISSGDKLEIVKGLKENDLVVVAGQEMLKDSIKVKIIK